MFVQLPLLNLKSPHAFKGRQSRLQTGESSDSGVRFQAAEYDAKLKSPNISAIHGHDSVVSPLIGELGRQTIINKSTGLVQLNRPLVEQIVRYRERAVEPLAELLEFSNSRRQVVEGLYTSQRMAETGTRNMNLIYAVVADRFKNTKDIWLQTYIAGFYRAYKEPAAAGHLMQMLMQNKGLASSNLMFNPNEEVGGALLELVSDQVAKKLHSQYNAPIPNYQKTANVMYNAPRATVNNMYQTTQLPALLDRFPAIS